MAMNVDLDNFENKFEDKKYMSFAVNISVLKGLLMDELDLI